MSTKRFLAGLVALLMALSILPAISLADSLGEYAPITTMDELTEGDYVIYDVRDAYTGIMNNTISGNKMGLTAVTFSGDNIAVTDASVVWHIAYVEGSGYTLYNAAAAKYAEITINKAAGFTLSDTPTMYYTIEANDDGTFDVYNASLSNRGIGIYQTDFRCYTVDGTNYAPGVSLYKYVESASDVCSAPAATPNGGTVKYGQQVSLICTTEGAVIYYSVDDGDTYEEYAGPFYLTESVTVYAYATAEGMADSDVMTFAFTVEEELANVTVAEAKALDNNTYTKVTGIVNFIDGKNVYVEDATGGICLYFLYADDPTLAEIALGDEVTAVGMKTTYKGLYELSNVVGGNPYWVSINSTGNDLPVQNVTIADLAANPIDYQCERVYIENGELGVINNSGNTPVSDGTNSINAYRLPALTGIDDYDIVNMYAVIGWYDAAQLRVQTADEVTFVSARQALTVNYVYEDGTEAAPAYVAPYAEGEAYSVASPEITGYNPDTALVEGTMGAEDVTVTVTYIQDITVPTYTLTIVYQYEDGAEAAETYTAELYENDEYSVTSPAVEGYLADQLVVSGTMPAEAVTVTVTYTAIAAAEETTYELVTDETGLVEGDKYIIVGVNGEEYFAMGYQRNNNRNAIAVTLNADGTITLTPASEAADEASAFEFTLGYDTELAGYTFLDPVTAGYLYAAGSTANYLRTQAEVDVNAAWTIAFADGATSIAAAGSSNRNVMQYNTSKLFSCYAGATLKPVCIYHKVENYVPVTTYTLTVNYQYEDGTEAAPVYTAELYEGEAYSVASPEIEGYMADVTEVAGVMGTEPVTVTVTYTLIPVGEETTYELITDAGQLVEGGEYIIVGVNGEVYSAMGYQRGNNRSAVQVTVNEDGTITTVPAAINTDEASAYAFTLGYDEENAGWTFYDALNNGYLYAAGANSNYLRTQEVNDINGVWTITFPGDDVASIVAEGSSNRNVMQYNSGSALFACYASASQKVCYIYGNVNNETPAEPTAHTLTINYVDVLGNIVAEAFTCEVNEGDPYSIPSPVIDGYVTLDAMIDGSMGAEDVTITVTYAMLGDADCDGVVGFADISIMCLFLSGVGEVNELGQLAADFDQDGDISFIDVSAIYLFVIGAA